MLIDKQKQIAKERSSKWYYDNIEKSKIRGKKYYEKNKEKIKKRTKNHKKLNIDKEKEYQKQYRLKNKENRYKKDKKRKLCDPLYKLSCLIRSSINQAFRRNNYTKKCKTYHILNISFIDFKQHIESKFEPWMNWSNHGLYNGMVNYGWDLDHIIPLSSAKTEEELINLFHYTNLQPLCGKINRDIKKNKSFFS